MVIGIGCLLARYERANAIASSRHALGDGSPHAAREVAALLHQLSSAARHTPGVPGPLVVSDVLRPAAVAIRTVCVLVGERAAMRDAEQLRLFVIPKLARVVRARHGCQRVVGVPGVLLSKVGSAVYHLLQIPHKSRSTPTDHEK